MSSLQRSTISIDPPCGQLLGPQIHIWQLAKPPHCILSLQNKSYVGKGQVKISQINLSSRHKWREMGIEIIATFYLSPPLHPCSFDQSSPWRNCMD